ncbi:centrosomal protein of 162 kDa isoform X2 [Ranitomeya variabilis]|uniref:centrosomal protein of 162 kDa isoform X2 n=1 Tax=Ranitomeya variabilis TaxID=490064 RepID=UPI0040565A40
MSHRLSKEELDEQFEQFLKESLSDDSFDNNKKSIVLENLGKPKVKEANKKNKKDASPWWLTEDDSGDGVQQSRSYLKQRKQKSQGISDKHNSELDHNLVRTSRSFLKSQSTSQPIEEVEEEEHVEEMQKSIDPLITSIEKDSLEIDESVVASGPNQIFHGVGLDTLEEQEEKERFFARLEKGASSTIDYSKLIKELDSTDSTQRTAYMRDNDRVPEDEDEHKDESKDLSVNYSEDFEDELEANSHLVRKSEEENDNPMESPNQNNEEQNHGMLAKVLLIDSMDSTIDTQKILQQTQDDAESALPQGTNEAIGTGISNQYTNSDMEALHQAYQNLDISNKGTDDQINYLKVTDNTIPPYEHGMESKENSMSRGPAGDSEMSTVDELMQRIREEDRFNASSVIMNTDKGMLPLTPQLPGHDPQESFQLDEASQNLHDWNGEKPKPSNVFPALTFNKKNIINTDQKDQKKQEQPKIAMEKSNSEMFAVYSSDRSGHADTPRSYPAVSTATSGLIHNKHSNKMVSSPQSYLKRVQNPHFSHVKSSGYGKLSIQMKRTSDDDSLKSKELHTDMKWKSPTSQKSKGVLSATSATKSIRFAENASSFPKDKMEHQETAAEVNIGDAKDYEKLNVPGGPKKRTSEFHEADVGVSDLTILQRLQNVEDKLNAGHGQTVTFLEGSLKKDHKHAHEIEEMKINYEKEIEELKRDNFILQTKLHAGEEKIKKRSHLFGDQNIPVSEEKMQQIRQEIVEQETLLHGYQQENERLYNQVKDLQVKNKQNEQQMFQENEALRAELISLREKLNSITPRNQYADNELDHNTRSHNDLATELRAVQKREDSLLEDIARYKKDKQALEVDLLQMKKERDLLRGQLANISDDKSYEIKIMEETYKKDIARLNKRLQWFAENQDILDKDAGRLKDAYEQIENLKTQVEKLRHDAGYQSVQQQNRVKDRAADAKRIQDLERQVKEMEAIIKRRHPNSIPALMFAAAAVSETDEPSKSSTVAYFERRIQKLESDIEGKDEDAKKTLRSMEQNFQKVKIQYERRINELEELLAREPLNEPQKNMNNMVKVKALEQELSICKDAHHSTVMNFQKEIDTLKAKNLLLKNGNIKSRNNEEEENTDQARITRLNQELVSKSKEIQELSKTVERLQKERMVMLTLKPHSSTVSSRNKHSGPTAGDLPPACESITEKEAFPLVLDEKLYQLDTFTDFNISDLQQQNKRLKAEVVRLSEQMNQQDTQYKTSLVNAEYALKRSKEEAAQQVASLRQSHQREMEKLICQQALEHSSSRVAELSSTLSTQEILTKHLQKQVVELQKDRETLAVLRIREDALQKEMAKLLGELKMAKECHSPEMKHFLTLECKIKQMEIRHSQREQELQQIIDQTRHVAEATQVKEIEKWRRLVQQKNMELEKFRTELDAILDVLRMLQKQGVVIPTSASEASELY